MSDKDEDFEAFLTGGDPVPVESPQPTISWLLGDSVGHGESVRSREQQSRLNAQSEWLAQLKEDEKTR